MDTDKLCEALARRLAKVDNYPLTVKNFTYKSGKKRVPAAPVASLSFEGSGEDGFPFVLQIYDEHVNLYVGDIAATIGYCLIGATPATVADQLITLLRLLANGQISIMSAARRGWRGRPYNVEILLSEDPERTKSVTSLVNFSWRGCRPGMLGRHKVRITANDAVSGMVRVPDDFFLYGHLPKGTVFAPCVPPISK